MADWTQPYARAVGIKWTPGVAQRLNQWQVWEGGATKNDASFNYMNSTLPMPGSSSINSANVQAYRTLAQGALSFAKTLNGRSDYAPLKTWIATGTGDPSAALQVWVSGKPDGNPSYAAKVLGRGPVAPPAGGHASSPSVAPTPSAARSPSIFTGGAPADPMASVRQQAAEGFADIAQGRSRPEDTFGPLLDTLQASGAPPAVPSVDIKGSSKLEQRAATLVRKFLGVQYQWGGESAKTGFDCSGLVQYVWKSLGITVPRTTYQQWGAGAPVAQGDLQPGDAVFFTGSDPQNDKPGHEGMYIGNGLFIEAPHSGASVRVSKLSGRSDYVGARRFA